MVMASCSMLVLSCGQKNELVKVEIVPDSPVVINADYIIPDPNPGNSIDEEETVAGPWFRFRIKVTNTSDTPVTIVSIVLKMTGYKNGIPVTGDSRFADEESGTGILAEVAAGATFEPQIYFYAHSLPEVDNFRYDVSATIEGWKGTAALPTERLRQPFRFNTQ